ncbi:hypothetical protein ACOMHN_022744 [Nucella lapillus]
MLSVVMLGLLTKLASLIHAMPMDRCQQEINCALAKNCFCATLDYPTTYLERIPQMVYFAFDGSLSAAEDEFYQKLLSTNQRNPNGCPITMSFYVDNEDTEYPLVTSYFEKGNEIGSNSVEQNAVETKLTLLTEAEKQKGNIVLMGQVPADQVVGWRSPELKTAGDAQPEGLQRFNYTYDTSLVYSPPTANAKIAWPFTMDFGYPYPCVIPGCPLKKHPGFWQVPVNPMYDIENGSYIYASDFEPSDPLVTLNYLKSNFEKVYTTNRAPFGLNMHAEWLQEPGHLQATQGFLKHLEGLNDVYIVSVKRVLEWMKKPVMMSQVSSLPGWGCTNPINIRAPIFTPVEAIITTTTTTTTNVNTNTSTNNINANTNINNTNNINTNTSTTNNTNNITANTNINNTNNINTNTSTTNNTNNINTNTSTTNNTNNINTNTSTTNNTNNINTNTSTTNNTNNINTNTSTTNNTNNINTNTSTTNNTNNINTNTSTNTNNITANTNNINANTSNINTSTTNINNVNTTTNTNNTNANTSNINANTNNNTTNTNINTNTSLTTNNNSSSNNPIVDHASSAINPAPAPPANASSNGPNKSATSTTAPKMCATMASASAVDCVQGANCLLPNCLCKSLMPPGGLNVTDTPQIILLTFSKGVNMNSYPAIRDILNQQNPNGCPISATFFVPASKNSPNDVEKGLRISGNEIAMYGSKTNAYGSSVTEQLVPTIKHPDNFQGVSGSINKGFRASRNLLKDDSLYGLLNASDILYDSSLVASRNMSLQTHLPWPYTLDFGAGDLCDAGTPFPTGSYKGIWEVPLTPLVDFEGTSDPRLQCTYAESCSIVPTTVQDTKSFFQQNLNNVLDTNRAPMGIHLQTDWFAHGSYSPQWVGGLKRFLKEALARPQRDVYVVTVEKMLDWMKNPIRLADIPSSQASWAC